MKPPPKTIAIIGPTASGKTNLALALAEALPVRLISMDSALVFKGMDIGTAKPDAATLARYPHDLIDIIAPEQSYSAAQFCADAKQLIQTAHQQNQIAVLVGGTLLYYKALIEGLNDLPSADASIRQQLEAEQAQHGLGYLYQQLQQFDPITAARLTPNDSQRIQRALEIYHSTGEPMSNLLAREQRQGLGLPCLTIALSPSNRSVLHQRISTRFDQMLEQGFLAEVQTLKQNPALHADLPSMRCVGYRQAWDYLEGQSNYADFKERAIAATRQLCKRQLTWMRSMVQQPAYQPWLELDCLEDNVPEVLKRVMGRLGFTKGLPLLPSIHQTQGLHPFYVKAQ